MKRRVPGNIGSFTGSGELKGGRTAETVSHDDGFALVHLSGFGETGEDEGTHLFAVIIELARFSFLGAGFRRTVSLALQVHGKGVIAHAGQHIGALAFIVGQAIPVMYDQHHTF
jgi:hypothetical protein